MKTLILVIALLFTTGLFGAEFNSTPFKNLTKKTISTIGPFTTLTLIGIGTSPAAVSVKELALIGTKTMPFSLSKIEKDAKGNYQQNGCIEGGVGYTLILGNVEVVGNNKVRVDQLLTIGVSINLAFKNDAEKGIIPNTTGVISFGFDNYAIGVGWYLNSLDTAPFFGFSMKLSIDELLQQDVFVIREF